MLIKKYCLKLSSLFFKDVKTLNVYNSSYKTLCDFARLLDHSDRKKHFKVIDFRNTRKDLASSINFVYCNHDLLQNHSKIIECGLTIPQSWKDFPRDEGMKKFVCSFNTKANSANLLNKERFGMSFEEFIDKFSQLINLNLEANNLNAIMNLINKAFVKEVA